MLDAIGSGVRAGRSRVPNCCRAAWATWAAS